MHGGARCDAPWMRLSWPALASLVLLGSVACGDDGAPTGSTETSSGSGSEGSSSGMPSTTTATPDDSGSSTAVVDDDTSSSSEGESSTGPAPELEVTPEVFTYPNQPMVVDVALRADTAIEATLQHATDPGVIVVPLPNPPDDDLWFRVRGLQPETDHELDFTATADGFSPAEGTASFTTEQPLPGFLPSFTVEGEGPGFGGYIMFDLLQFPGPGASGLFVIDSEGVTRWHLGLQDEVTGAEVVFAAAQLLDDGSVLYLRNHTLYVRDELGAEVIAIDDDEAGLTGLHHDVRLLPNGNFLALSFSFQDVEYDDLGLVNVAGDVIAEITPDGDVVWTWDSFDHLDPQRRRDDFDALILNPTTLQPAFDWTHGNGIVYEPDTDSVILSLRHQDWILRIDRATGDVLWRLGEEGDFALGAGDWFFHQHSPQWQDDGTLLLYDNGVGNPNLPDDQEFSRAVRYALDVPGMEATLAWEDEAEDFTAVFAGDADRLPNGNILVTDSSIGLLDGMLHARIREVNEASSATPVWSITTDLDRFIYRGLPIDRLPGEPTR
jgi:hypothetical protein